MPDSVLINVTPVGCNLGELLVVKDKLNVFCSDPFFDNLSKPSKIVPNQ